MFRVSNMLTTAHYEHGRCLAKISLFCELIILILSAAITIFSFSNFCTIIGSEVLCSNINTFLPFFAPCIFIFSIVLLKLNLRGKASMHLKVAEMLVPMKAQISDLQNSTSFSEDRYDHVRDKYNIITSSFVTIPDNVFHKYKRKHQAKISLSRQIDQYPNAPLLLLKLKLFICDTFSCVFSSNK